MTAVGVTALLLVALFFPKIVADMLLRGVIIVAIVAILLGGCATTPPVNSLCGSTDYIRVKCAKENPDCGSKSGFDELTPETAREILNFNATRQKVCRQ